MRLMQPKKSLKSAGFETAVDRQYRLWVGQINRQAFGWGYVAYANIDVADVRAFAPFSQLRLETRSIGASVEYVCISSRQVWKL